MAKYYGIIGYAVTSETSPGIWVDRVLELNYSGDIIKNTRRWQSGESLNDDLTVNNIFSIVADPYAYQNFHSMKYIDWMGTSWKITNVEVQRPRLLLTVGGVYNGDKTPITNTP